MTEAFSQHCIVELMGRQIIAGLVTEAVIGGQGLIRVDVPETENRKAFTKFFSSGAIYAITPVDEATCLAAVQGLQAKPVQEYTLNLKQLRAPAEDTGTFATDHEYDPGF